MSEQNQNRQNKKQRRIILIVIFEILLILVLFYAYRWYVTTRDVDKNSDSGNRQEQNGDQQVDNGGDGNKEEDNQTVTQTPEEQEAAREQERLKQENADREALIAQADQLALGYDYDGAIGLLQGYQSEQGGYLNFPMLTDAVNRLETEKSSLVNLGGSYDSVTQINHIFFHTLIVDSAKAFDGDSMAKGYNMYMATIPEFNKILKKLYKDGYVLVNMSDLTEKVTLEDGTAKYVEKEINLRPGKKPLVISQDDVSYYDYMKKDGFANRIILTEDGKITCQMALDDGSVTTGAFDMVPLIDDFVKEHPDFSYQGAKGLIALTGYEGILGYRTNDPDSPTYEEDKKVVSKVAEAMKAEGWEFASHSWGHKNMQEITLDHLKRDTQRWLDEVAPLIGGTDILVFPFGVDIETTVGTYSSDKYKYLKSKGFNVFCGVYSKPWMHIKKDYVRMTRQPIDGQALLEFPKRLEYLFDPKEIIDPDRPGKNW